MQSFNSQPDVHNVFNDIYIAIIYKKQKLTDLKTSWSAMDSTTGSNYPKILSYNCILFILFLLFISINHLLCYTSDMCDIFIWS